MIAVRLEANQTLVIGKLDNLPVRFDEVFDEYLELVPQNKVLCSSSKLFDEVDLGVELESENVGCFLVSGPRVETFVVLQ